MAKEKPIAPRSRWGSIGDVIRNLRVSWRLFKDRRVPIWLKGIPILALVYLIWPFDFLTDFAPGLGQVDDLTLILLSLVLFIGLCPPQLVAEHRGQTKALTKVPDMPDEEVIDTTFRVVDEEKQANRAQD